MRYNTTREDIIFKEYGRHIQKMVQQAAKIEDDETRNTFALRIIDLMGQVNPQLKNVDDFKHKLWDHLFLLSDFKLFVDSPFPLPTREQLTRVVVHLDYPQTDLKFKHYGKNVEYLIEKASEMEDPAKKAAFTKVIANYMKQVYQNWNGDTVSDELIKNDLVAMSKGKLALDENMVLDRISRSANSYRDRDRDRDGGGYGGGYGRDRGDRGDRRRGSYGGKRGGGRNFSNNNNKRRRGYKNNGR